MALNNINPHIQAAVGAFQFNAKSPAKRVETKNVTSFKDEVQLSARAQEVANAVKKLKNMSDVRTGPVDFFTKEIESGNYNVPAANIASKLISARF